MTASLEKPPNVEAALEHDDAPTRRVGAKKRWRPGNLITYLILVPGAILFVAPFAWLVSASFQSIGDMFSYPPQWIPENPTLNGYETFLGTNEAGRSGRGASSWSSAVSTLGGFSSEAVMRRPSGTAGSAGW